MRSPLKDGYLFQKRRWQIIVKILDRIGFIFIRPFIGHKEPPKNPRKILISKIDHLGDVLLALTILPLIRQIYPLAEIHFLAGGWSSPLLNGHPDIKRLLIYDDFFLNRNPNLFKRAIRSVITFLIALYTLREEKYDIGIDLRAYFPNSLILLFLGGVHYRVGYGTGGFGFLLHKQGVWRLGVHETEHFVDLFRSLNLRIDNPSPQSTLDYLINLRETNIFLNEQGIYGGDKFIIAHPGAGNRTKYWPVASWKEVIENIDGYKILFTGTDEEYKFIEKIISISSPQSKTKILNLAGKTDIPLLAGLIKKAKTVIGTESFVSHLSASIGIPTVIIANGIADINQWRPVRRGRVEVVTNPVECSPCYLSKGCETMDCIKVLPITVIEKLRELL